MDYGLKNFGIAEVSEIRSECIVMYRFNTLGVCVYCLFLGQSQSSAM